MLKKKLNWSRVFLYASMFGFGVTFAQLRGTNHLHGWQWSLSLSLGLFLIAAAEPWVKHHDR